MRFLANRPSVTLSAHKLHGSCILSYSPNWAVKVKEAECYGNVYYTSTLNLKLERNISVALAIIYPCKRQEKRPFITLSFQWIMFMESFYCYESGFTPTWRGVKSQISLSWISLCSLSLGSHQDICLHYTYSVVTVIYTCPYL